MMYQLQQINHCVSTDAKGFIDSSEAAYHTRIVNTTTRLLETCKERPILLVNGPSSSSKTTTAKRIGNEFAKHGVRTNVISMDDYYRTRGTYEMPYDEEGVVDLESPFCMDLPLLSDHLYRLALGEEIGVPHFDFETKCRTEETTPMHLGADEVAIIEGIHAFNDIITGSLEEKSSCIYLSVESSVQISADCVIQPEMLRFMRRAVRDRNFRDYPVPATVAQWRSVRRGEREYIAPYIHYAKERVDTYLPYESHILMQQLQTEISTLEAEMSHADLAPVYQAIGRFVQLDEIAQIPDNSILHEFIG